jgi:ribonuclease T2
MRSYKITLLSLLLIASCNLPAQESASAPALEPLSAPVPAPVLPAPAPELIPESSANFDYWVLSLSWSPQFCSENSFSSGYGIGDSSTSRQCDRSYAFVVHGLWPQNESGYPQDCKTEERVTTALIDRMLPLMPDPQLVRHEWREHGACSGLPINDYFMTVESIYRSFVIPEVYRDPRLSMTTNMLDFKRDFMNANPKLEEDQFALQCSGKFLREVRVCYDHNFHFRSCGEDVRDRCRAGDIILRPKR